ncbi:phosphatase PAP2 family protein [Microbacterium sp.]|uniref:phosphatase PAP2 family protein n=1 Tax=Microbacterium sp. TaxID=51671 RepID=UPI002811C12D|nr:phosphatase PAP2 family protein [Microbacterium sp.]
MRSPLLSRRQLTPLLSIGLLAIAVLVVPAPGSVSVIGTQWFASAGSGIRDVDLISEAGLLLLAATTAASIVFAWVRHPERRARLVAGAGGVVVAYAVSEGAKLLFAQPRPCSRWRFAAACPPAGDWSLPSNHATLAFGAVVVIAIALGRTRITWPAVGIATLVAIGRVAQGVHYLHDVALGALLGLAVTVTLVTLAPSNAVSRPQPRRATEVTS